MKFRSECAGEGCVKHALWRENGKNNVATAKLHSIMYAKYCTKYCTEAVSYRL